MTPPGDPLARMLGALAGVALAVALAVPVAALLGAALADAFGGGYGHRVAVYAGLLLYLLTGAVLLLVRVAAQEQAPLSAARVGRWFLSLWLWPLLLFSSTG